MCLFGCVVLSRLKTFLPEIAAANTQLDEQMQQSPSACNIENVQDCDGPIIEMVSVSNALTVSVINGSQCQSQAAKTMAHPSRLL